MIAFITVREVDKQEPTYMHFGCTAGKSWNCTKKELFYLIKPGNRIKIDYSEGAVKEGFKYPPKYIQQARPCEPGEENTWPDKEPYNPSGGGSSMGGSKSIGTQGAEFRTPNQMQRAAIFTALCTWSKAKTIEELISECDKALAWADEKPADTFREADKSGDGDVSGDDSDIPF